MGSRLCPSVLLKVDVLHPVESAPILSGWWAAILSLTRSALEVSANAGGSHPDQEHHGNNRDDDVDEHINANHDSNQEDRCNDADDPLEDVHGRLAEQGGGRLGLRFGCHC